VTAKPFGRSTKRHLIAGLIVIAPITITGFVLWWIFQTVDGLLGRVLYPLIGFPVPGLGIITLILLLIAIGWLAERALGSRVVAWWHTLLERIPVARRIYSAANSIVRTVFGEGQRRPFKDVVLVEFPAPGRWSVGFLAGDAPTATLQPGEEDRVTVFVPTTPNPTTGFLIMVPRSEVRTLAMSIDQAFTFILSAGSVTPPVTEPLVSADQP